MGMKRIVRMSLGSAALASLLIASGCASRGFVRTQVGESSDTLTTRIEEGDSQVEGQVNEARTELSAEISDVADETAAQATRIDETQAELDSTREDIQEDIADVRNTADQALADANQANAEIVTLSRLFGDRNRFRVDLTRDFLFSFDRAELEVPEGPEMAEISEVFEENPNAVIVLEGRTDNTGDEQYNIQLGERRVEAVRRYLIVDMGVPVYRIHSFSYGESMPRASNEDAEGRTQNRAVTMHVLTPVESESSAGAIDE